MDRKSAWDGDLLVQSLKYKGETSFVDDGLVSQWAVSMAHKSKAWLAATENGGLVEN